MIDLLAWQTVAWVEHISSLIAIVIVILILILIIILKGP